MAKSVRQEVDNLAAITNAIVALETKKVKIVASLKSKGIGHYNGTYLAANVFDSTHSHVDHKALYEAQRISQSVINSFTISKPIVVLKLSAKKVG